MVRTTPAIAASAIKSRTRDKGRAIQGGRANMNCVTTMTVRGINTPKNSNRCKRPGKKSCRILLWAIPSTKRDFIRGPVGPESSYSWPTRHRRNLRLIPQMKTMSARRMKNTSKVLIMLSCFCRSLSKPFVYSQIS
ncbi:hypothetical protein ES703_12046 [subsurface metagenome]